MGTTLLLSSPGAALACPPSGGMTTRPRKYRIVGHNHGDTRHPGSTQLTMTASRPHSEHSMASDERSYGSHHHRTEVGAATHGTPIYA
ncbi:hypothetical protein PR001_g11086 [Phytophthora rubi]|nr:hypothetical protein PR001_g11086 [Phytophthora rubi]